MQTARKIVAYFDFDGTITSRDTLLPFLIYTVGVVRFIRALPKLICILLRYWLKRIDNEQAKEDTLTLLIAGLKYTALENKAKNFALTKLHKYIKPVIYAKIEWHREHGHDLYLVSANLGIYLRYWAALHKIERVIATELEVDHEKYMTGKLASRNCYGEQKIIRLEKYLRENNLKYDYSYGYGNSAGDYELLQYVDEPYWIKGEYIKQWSLE